MREDLFTIIFLGAWVLAQMIIYMVIYFQNLILQNEKRNILSVNVKILCYVGGFIGMAILYGIFLDYSIVEVFVIPSYVNIQMKMLIYGLLGIWCQGVCSYCCNNVWIISFTTS